MRKSIFSILLCFIMAVGMFPTAAVAETAPEFKAEDLESINIPDTLVTVRCTTTGDSKTYGAIDGGFDTDKATPYLDSEDNVYKVIVSLKLSAYKNQYDTDTGAEHVVSGIGSTVITFKLKYVDSAWMIEGNFPSVPIFVTCGGHATSGPPTDGGHENQQPEIPMYPTNDSISGLGDNIVAVLCTNVQGGQQSGKYYGLIDGGFTFTEPKLNDDVYESTITLIPSAYCNQYSTDTGIEHQVNPNQTTEGLSFVVRYDPEENMWIPKEELKQMGIWVKCDSHEVQQPEMPMYPTTDSISGLGDNIVAVLCTNVQGGQQSGKYYGLIDGGFTFTEPKLNDDVYESTITLIPSAYCNQYSTDTGIEHQVNPNQTTEGLSFVVRYDPEENMWIPKEELKQMGIWVKCDSHEVQQPEMPMYPTTDSISGLGDNIVGVVCMNAPDKTKFYGLINGGFTSTKPEFNFKTGAYESTITLIPSVYCSQYSTDTGIEHQVNPNQTTEGLSFVVKYDLEKNMWMPTEEVKQMGIWVKCDNHEAQQPEIPMYPTNDSISGLGDNIVGVVCMNAPDKTKFYGLINGGFTSTKPKLNDGVYESTLTLIPSVYCKQYSADTGIMHQVNPNQTTEGLSFVVRYDLEKNMWMPTEEVKQMGIWVICDKHEGGNGGTTDPGTTPGGNTGPGETTDPGTTPGGSTDPDTTPGGNDGNTKPDNKPGDNGNNQGSDKSGTDPVDNAPQTEDISNMSLWLAIMLLNIGALLGTVVFIRKHKRV